MMGLVVFFETRGDMLLWLQQRKEWPKDPLEIELFTILHGLQFCLPLAISSLIDEGDSLLAI